MISGWGNFFVAEVGASAALAGLLFVGVSINLDRILKFRHLPNRALEALVALVAILVLSSLLLVPGQSWTAMGAEVLLIGVVYWAVICTISLRSWRLVERKYRATLATTIFIGQVSSLPLLVAGIFLLCSDSAGLYWVVFAFLASIVFALRDAWVLLIEINR